MESRLHLANLISIKSQLSQAVRLIEKIIDAQPQSTSGKPPQPDFGQRIEKELWRAWDKLKAAGEFTAAEAKSIVKEKPCENDSSYSGILSKWAKLGYIRKIRGGKGPVAAVYSIENSDWS